MLYLWASFETQLSLLLKKTIWGNTSTLNPQNSHKRGVINAASTEQERVTSVCLHETSQWLFLIEGSDDTRYFSEDVCFIWLACHSFAFFVFQLSLTLNLWCGKMKAQVASVCLKTVPWHWFWALKQLEFALEGDKDTLQKIPTGALNWKCWTVCLKGSCSCVCLLTCINKSLLSKLKHVIQIVLKSIKSADWRRLSLNAAVITGNESTSGCVTVTLWLTGSAMVPHLRLHTDSRETSSREMTEASLWFRNGPANYSDLMCAWKHGEGAKNYSQDCFF